MCYKGLVYTKGDIYSMRYRKTALLPTLMFEEAIFGPEPVVKDRG